MDYDDDGIQDIISGSYDPGDIYLMKGIGDGKYAKVKNILDENDLPLVHHPLEMAKYEKYKAEKEANKTDSDEYVPDSNEAQQWRVSTFGSWPAAVDWDSDGDLDMLIGTFSGELFLRTNIGTRSQPNFSGEPLTIKVAGEPLKEAGHAAPVVADWDADGLWDLIVGSSDGSVGWYRNTGSEGSPAFGARQLLVAPSAPAKFMFQYIRQYELSEPGVRAQICVTDYNQDGRLDLIVGDYKDVFEIKELSDSEQQKLDDLIAREKKFSARMVEIQNEFFKKYEEPNEEQLKEFSDTMDKYVEDFGYEQLEEEKKKYLVEDSRVVSNIWLYLRKPEMKKADEAL